MTNLAGLGGISIDVRELRDSKGAVARGVVVQVDESQYRKERSFVDGGEISELLKGIDALLEVKGNPTSLKNFEVRYTTRGELQLTAFSSSTGAIMYAVQAERFTKAQRIGLSVADTVGPRPARAPTSLVRATLAEKNCRTAQERARLAQIEREREQSRDDLVQPILHLCLG